MIDYVGDIAETAKFGWNPLWAAPYICEMCGFVIFISQFFCHVHTDRLDCSTDCHAEMAQTTQTGIRRCLWMVLSFTNFIERYFSPKFFLLLWENTAKQKMSNNFWTARGEQKISKANNIKLGQRIKCWRPFWCIMPSAAEIDVPK